MGRRGRAAAAAVERIGFSCHAGEKWLRLLQCLAEDEQRKDSEIETHSHTHIIGGEMIRETGRE